MPTEIAPNPRINGQAPLTANVVLASIPADQRERLTAAGTWVTLPRGAVLQRQGTALSHVYFPVCGLVTGILSAPDGSQYAYLHRGREGAIYSIAAARLDDSNADCTLLVDLDATLLAVPMADFRRALHGSPELLRAVLMHAAYAIKWLERTLNCPGHHPILARTAYWLLLLHAYGAGDDIRVTHGRIADVLGVRRQSISEALGDLQDEGAITLGRERIVIRDLTALARYSCACRTWIADVVKLHRAGHLPFAA